MFDSYNLNKNIVIYLRNMHSVKTAYLIHVILFNINNYKLK